MLGQVHRPVEALLMLKFNSIENLLMHKLLCKDSSPKQNQLVNIQ